MTHEETIKRIQELRCKSYTQAKGQYSSFYSGERCKRKAITNGYCKQHLLQTNDQSEETKTFIGGLLN